MDVFVGSGTTAAAAHKLGRKWIAVDSGDFVDKIVLRRMKSVVMGDLMPKLSEDLCWKGGGFFKYYDLEQYEDALSKVHYAADTKPYSDDVFRQYVFFADEKFASVLEEQEGKFSLDFSKLYGDIDFPETISMLFGKEIERVDENFVYLAEMDAPIKYNLSAMNQEEKIAFFRMLKPYLWWGE